MRTYLRITLRYEGHEKIEFNKKPDESQVEDFTKLAEDRKN